MSNRINLTTSDFKSPDPSRSGAFKKLGGEITEGLSLSQQKALYEKMKENKGSFDTVRDTFKDLEKNKSDGISKFAVGRMERAIRNRNKLGMNRNPSLQTGQFGYVGISSAAKAEKVNAEMASRPPGSKGLSGDLMKKNMAVTNTGLIIKR